LEADGEQMTIRNRDCFSAAVIRSLRSKPPDSECGDQRRQSRGVTQRQHMVGSLKLGKGGYETSDTLGSGGGKLEGD
jgi:hypothetical protein